MSYETLSSWHIEKDCFEGFFFLGGEICESEHRMKGEYIYTDVIMKIENRDDGYYVRTLCGEYLLKGDFLKDDDTPVFPFRFSEKARLSEVIEFLERQEKQMRLIAERLLSAGDSMVFNRFICYRSKKGIEIIYPHKDRFDYIYEFPEEDFKVINSDGSFCVKRKQEYDGGCLYNVVAAANRIERNDYRHLDLKAQEIGLTED